jgi:general secretion pathway protein I
VSGAHKNYALMQAGFTLLEAIVALAIMATVGLALFTWIAQGIDTARRLQAATERADMQMKALALVERVNPAQQFDGTIVVDDLSVEWRSRPQEPLRPVYGFVGGGKSASIWQVGLFVMDVTARSTKPAGEMIQFELLKAGWRQSPAGNPDASLGKP